MKRIITFVVALAMFGSTLQAQTKSEKTAKELIGDYTVGDVVETTPRQLPIILWGGEAATFWANGGTTTTAESIFGKAGLSFKLTPGDDSVQQAKDYLTGKSPYFRGTYLMASVYEEEFNKDPRTKPVMILQLSYSQGDHMVSREPIKTLNDLKGKTICLQGPGPHFPLVQDSLDSVGLTWNDIKVKWAKDLTGPNGPAEMMRKDPTIDVACVITPDMIGLCSGIDEIGSGAEGTVKGSHVLNSTATMSRSIADVYLVRKDFFDANKAEVEKFVTGYLKATEAVVKASKTYSDSGKMPQYVTVMKQIQQTFGADALPTIEEDVHGLILDCRFARIPGNESFFTDPKSLVGFKAKQTAGLAMAKTLGYSTTQTGFTTASWDYKEISKNAGVKYVQPTFATGRVKAEITDFGEDLDSATIFTFEVKFEPGQKTFDIEKYGPEIQRFAKASATFGNGAALVEGNSDPTLALQHFYWAAKAKGLLTGSRGGYKFKGKPITLENTAAIVSAIQSEDLSGQTRTNKAGQRVEIPDPRTTVAAAQQLSKERAMNFVKSIQDYVKKHDLNIDISAAIPSGVGIASPAIARPRNIGQAKENMRVVFRIVKVKAEALSDDDFNFEDN
jgi:hypothetical protein